MVGICVASVVVYYDYKRACLTTNNNTHNDRLKKKSLTINGQRFDGPFWVVVWRFQCHYCFALVPHGVEDTTTILLQVSLCLCCAAAGKEDDDDELLLLLLTGWQLASSWCNT